MDNSITRRVDHLGRVVIPKEYRKRLRINEGDCLEVFLNDDKIILSKKNLLDLDFNVIKNIVDIISKQEKVLIVITDLDKIVYTSRNEQILKNIILSNEIINKIKLNKEDINKDFIINNNNYKHYFLQPIIINGDISGSIIFLKNETINSNDRIYINLLNKLLIKYLEV